MPFHFISAVLSIVWIGVLASLAGQVRREPWDLAFLVVGCGLGAASGTLIQRYLASLFARSNQDKTSEARIARNTHQFFGHRKATPAPDLPAGLKALTRG